MIKKCSFVIPGNIRTKQSFRIGKNNNFPDPKVVNFHALVTMTGRDAWPYSPSSEPFDATIICYFRRPKNHFKKNGEFSKEGSRFPNWCIKKKDVDNITKGIFDPLEKIVYENDSQVVSLQVMKLWDNTGRGERTEVILREVEDV